MTKSEEWDKKINWKPALPFTPKILIGLGILVLLITLVIAFATPPIYAGSVLETNEEVDLDQSYHIAILTSQALLMEKIDWNNCALSYKTSKGYGGEPIYGNHKDWDGKQHIDSYIGASNLSTLKELCGEIP